MWNKKYIVFIVMLTFCLSPLKSQDFLGKSKNDVLKFMERNTPRISQIELNNDSVSFIYEEEDEINRMFDIHYAFLFSDDVCVSYVRKLPVNEYFLKTILDMVSLKEGKGSCYTFSIEGESLHSVYEFENFFLKLALKDDVILQRFESKKSNHHDEK